MTKQDRETLARYYVDCNRSGITYDDADTLRRCAMTLHRWCEQECGDSNDYASWAIERDETDGKPYRCVYPYQQGAKTSRVAIPDREKGALKRVAAIIAKLDGASYEYQGDPRGWPLTVKLADGRTIAPPVLN